MARRKPAPKPPKRIKEIGYITKIECEATCPICRTTSSTMIGGMDTELDYGNVYYEGDSPSTALQGDFWCDPCEATFTANTKGYPV